MCDRHWAFGSLFMGTLLLGAASDAAAQWSGYPPSSTAGHSSYYQQLYARQATCGFQPGGGNATYMNHFVGRQVRHNAYQLARAEGMQIRVEQERVRGELARVKNQNKFERRFASVRVPDVSWQSARPTSSLTDGMPGQSIGARRTTLGLTQQDVAALREHYEALADIHALRREHILSVSPQKQVARSLPSQFDRTSGRVTWPALLLDDSRFREDLQRVNKALAKWAQYGHDPTSWEALRVRKTIEKMTRDLLVMHGTGVIDETAYHMTRAFLESAAYETQFSDSEESGDTTDDVAWSQ